MEVRWRTWSVKGFVRKTNPDFHAAFRGSADPVRPVISQTLPDLTPFDPRHLHSLLNRENTCCFIAYLRPLRMYRVVVCSSV